MGNKSRGNWQINVCLKDCKNKDRKCGVCIKYNKFVPVKDNRK